MDSLGALPRSPQLAEWLVTTTGSSSNADLQAPENGGGGLMPPPGSIENAKMQLASHVPSEAWKWVAGMACTGRLVTAEEAAWEHDCVVLERQGIAHTFVDNVVRIPYVANVTFAESGADLPLEPCVLTGCCSDWPAWASLRWTVSSLAARLPPTASFAVDGGPGFARDSLSCASVSMQAYSEYCDAVEEGRVEADSAPLYIFDPKLATRTFDDGSPLLDAFTVPHCFTQDTMSLCPSTRPLPTCWLLVGVQGSGTPIHDHPLTVAWNTLLSGCKLWVLLPPDVDPACLLVGQFNTASEDFDLSAAEWFTQWGGGGGATGTSVTTNTRGTTASSLPPLPPSARVCVQREGETLFAPAGWWHVVYNVRTSTALSHSLALRRDFDAGWAILQTEAAEESLAEGDVSLAEEWRRSVAALDAHLAAGGGKH